MNIEQQRKAFDEWLYPSASPKAAWDAGQNSKQEEINSLKKEIDELKVKMQSALNTACRLQYSSGEIIYREIKELLK